MAHNSPELAASAAKIDREQLQEKTRVHALAKMLGVSSAKTLEILDSQGIGGKRAMSTVTKPELVSVLDSLGAAEEKAAAKKTAAKKRSVKKTAAKKTADKKSAAKKTAAKKTTAKKATAKDVAKDAIPAEDVVEKTSTEESTAKKGEAKKSSAKKSAEKDAAPQKKVPKKRAAKATKKRVTKQAEPEEVAQPESKPEVIPSETLEAEQTQQDQQDQPERKPTTRRRTRKVRRVVRRFGAEGAQESQQDKEPEKQQEKQPEETPAEDTEPQKKSRRGTRRSRRSGKAITKNEQPQDEQPQNEDLDPTQLHPAERDQADIVDEPVRLRGSTRLESRRKWRAENRRDSRHVVSRSEFLARRESVERIMVVRDSERSDHPGLTTQVGVVEDGMLVEHFVTSETQQSMVGNVYLGTVQNVLSSMEAAFIDLGTGRNAVLYAGEMNWHSPHLRSKSRRIDAALRPGDQIMVQVIKDPVGHKGARLTARISFAGRFLVYFPGGTTAGISRKLPEAERKRLKNILSRVIPGDGGAIIRTAAENVDEEDIGADVQRLHNIWEGVLEEEKRVRKSKGAKPVTLYEEPNMLIKVIRDILNPDFSQLIVDGEKSWSMVRNYVSKMAADLSDRVVKWHPEQHGGQDVFAGMNLDEQLTKALSRKVWLPSGGHLVFDNTEAMTVVDVNTGSFIGSGGNLEETVTQNNLEAAEEIVRQMRLRDLGGMIVVDFIDMVLEENQDLVLRRLTEFLGRDRTHHKVSEVTSLGLVQMTRKRLGTGLLDTFSTVCEHCGGRGVIIHADPVEHDEQQEERPRRDHGNRKERQQARREKKRREEIRQRRAEAEQVEQKEQQEQKEKTEQQGDKPQRRDQGTRNRRSRRQVERPQDQTRSTEQDSGQTQRTTRRRVRRVVRRHSLSQSANATSDSTQSGSTKPGRGKGASASERATQSADRAAAQRAQSKRRGRRVVRSPRYGESHASEQKRTQPQPKTQAQPKSPAQTQTYEQARAEFDSSPRRKRSTRGNSRSDIPPRREDFPADKQTPEPKRGGSEVASSGKKRRGRRVVRRSH